MPVVSSYDGGWVRAVAQIYKITDLVPVLGSPRLATHHHRVADLHGLSVLHLGHLRIVLHLASDRTRIVSDEFLFEVRLEDGPTVGKVYEIGSL